MHNNRETVIIPQTIIVPTKSIIVASLVLNEAYCLPFSKHTQRKYVLVTLAYLMGKNTIGCKIILCISWGIFQAFWRYTVRFGEKQTEMKSYYIYENLALQFRVQVRISRSVYPFEISITIKFNKTKDYIRKLSRVCSLISPLYSETVSFLSECCRPIIYTSYITLSFLY